jgi:hypothetical protein
LTGNVIPRSVRIPPGAVEFLLFDCKGVVMIIIGKVSEETKGIMAPMWVEGGAFPYRM